MKGREKIEKRQKVSNILVIVAWCIILADYAYIITMLS